MNMILIMNIILIVIITTFCRIITGIIGIILYNWNNIDTIKP